MWFGRNLRDLGSQHEQSLLAVAVASLLPYLQFTPKEASTDETMVVFENKNDDFNNSIDGTF